MRNKSVIDAATRAPFPDARDIDICSMAPAHRAPPCVRIRLATARDSCVSGAGPAPLDPDAWTAAWPTLQASDCLGRLPHRLSDRALHR